MLSVQNNMKRVAILYLCYGAEEYMRMVADGIASQTYPKEALTFVCIPNGSTGNASEIVQTEFLPRSKKDLPEVVLLDDGKNHGFSGGNNLAITWAIERGYEYILLHNGDLVLEPETIERMVAVAEGDEKIASVQPLVLHMKSPEVINVSGGIVHIAGFGYARDNGTKRSQRVFEEVEDVTYATGAALLVKTSVIKEVGLLEDRFFMYHEDLEWGLRFRIAGYRNVLASKALALHDYAFTRNPKKFAWMELYRHVVLFGYLKPLTLLLVLPILVAVEGATTLLAIKGGWFSAKRWAWREWLRLRTYRLIFSIRTRTKRLRVISDRELVALFSGRIEAQEQSSFIVERFANPVLTLLTKGIQFVVRW